MNPWNVFKWIIQTFLAGSFIVQRGWGCRGCLVGLLWFIGIAYILMYLLPAPGFDLPPYFTLGIAAIFIFLAVIVGKITGRKNVNGKFTGRNNPD